MIGRFVVDQFSKESEEHKVLVRDYLVWNSYYWSQSWIFIKGTTRMSKKTLHVKYLWKSSTSQSIFNWVRTRHLTRYSIKKIAEPERLCFWGARQPSSKVVQTTDRWVVEHRSEDWLGRRSAATAETRSSRPAAHCSTVCELKCLQNVETFSKSPKIWNIY